MNIFDYFAEEETDMERKLEELTTNYEVWSREKVFDSVKEVCDAITGHLKKQNVLLLAPLKNSGSLSTIFQEAQKDHSKVEEEIGQLVEVHVDEPGYDEYLSNLLKVLIEHVHFSKKLYECVKTTLSAQEMDNLNAQFNNVVLHSTDFNSLQAPNA